MTRCRRAARGADEGRGPGRTWQQVGEAAHGALQLRGGGRVPPHVLLVALAQLPQPVQWCTVVMCGSLLSVHFRS